MGRRRKKDTEKTLELVVGMLVGIPVVSIAALKWMFSGISKLDRQKNSQLAGVDLQEVDQMDGFAFEYYVAELLKKNGFKNVLVTNGSGDFGVDITACKNNVKYAFQCKNYQSKLGISPIQEVYSGAPKYNASVCVVVTNSYFTPHAHELAKSLNVLLWDRTELEKLICVSNDKENSILNDDSRLNNEKAVCVKTLNEQPELEEWIGFNDATDNLILRIPISGGFVPASLVLTQNSLIYRTRKKNEVYPIDSIEKVMRFVARLQIVITNREKPLDLAVGRIGNAKAMEQVLLEKLEERQKRSFQDLPKPEVSMSVQELVAVINGAIKQEQNDLSESISNIEKNNNMQENLEMATTLGAGKYVFGVDIPEGKYNLKAISGSGSLEIQKLIDGTWEEDYMSFGVEEHNVKTYHGLSLPKNRYFEVSGNVVFEITRATMIEIE